MIRVYKFIIFLSFAFVTNQAFAQNISPKDTAEIKLVVKRKIENSLADLMNYISSGFDGDAQVQENIKKSFTASNTQVFYDKNSIIEDDINPNHVSAKDVQDSDVEKYLNNLDLLYNKNEETTIFFSDVRTSNVKRAGDNTYIKAYYSSHFKGTHKSINTQYQPTKRVAELRLEKNGKRWAANIVRLAFVTPDDSMSSTKNDLVIMPDSSAMLTDSAAAALAFKLENERILKEQEELKKQKDEFDKILADADEAFNAKEYELALSQYQKAKEKNKEEYGKFFQIQVKISRTKKAIQQEEERKKQEEEKQKQEDERKRQEQLIADYRKNITEAKIAERRRFYDKAIRLYQAAFLIKPDSSFKYETIIKHLTEKLRIQTELDEIFVAGNYKDLKEKYDKILKTNKEDSDYYLGRGRCYVKLGEYARALKDFDQAILLDYSNCNALINRAELHIQQNNIPKAVADYSSFLSIEKDSASVYVKRARLRITTNNPKSALEDFNKAIELAPKNPNYYFERAMLNYNTKEHSKALKDFTSAVELNNSFAMAFYQRGLLYNDLKKYKEAGDDFMRAKALELDPVLVNNFQNIASAQLNDGEQDFINNRLDSALPKFINATLIQQDYWLAWYKRGECYAAQKNYDTAIENYTKAISFRQNYDDAFYKRGIAKYSLGKYKESIADFQQTNDLNPSYYQAMFAQGSANLQLQDYKAAIVWFQKIKIAERNIEKQYPKLFFANTHGNLGICMYYTKYFVEALPELNAAIKLNEEYAEAYYYRGLVNHELARYKDAIEDIGRSIELKPQKYEKHFARGLAYYNIEKFAEANNEFTEAIRLDVDKNEIFLMHQMRGKGYYNLGKFKEAVDDLSLVNKLDSSKCDSRFYLLLGIAQLKLNKTTEAAYFINKSLVLDPSNSEASYALACNYLATKDVANALKTFEMAFQTKKITNQFVRKDDLLSFVNKDFRDNKEFKDLIKKYLK